MFPRLQGTIEPLREAMNQTLFMQGRRVFDEVLAAARAILRQTFGFDIVGVPLDKPTSYILRNELELKQRAELPWGGTEVNNMVHCALMLT